MVPFLSVIRVFWCEFFQSKVLPILELAISWLNLLRSMIFQMVDLKKIAVW